MTARSYLERVGKIDALIKNKTEERRRWDERAKSVGGVAIGEPVQASKNPHRGAEAVDNCIDIDREISVLKRERQEIIKTVERLPPIEYDLIFKHYIGEYDKAHGAVRCYTRKELAYHFGKSLDWVKLRKKHALALLQAILDQRGAE